MDEVKVGENISFFLIEEEANSIFDFIAGAGYEKNGNGVKDFLLDVIEGEFEEKPKEEKEKTLFEKVASDPEAAMRTAKTLHGIFKNFQKVRK